MTPTEQQLAIEGALRCSLRHLMVVARAGTGKTTTLVWLVNRLLEAQPRLRVLALAFNKHIADELSRRMPRAKCQTSHSLAMGMCKAGTAGAATVDDGKLIRIIRSVCPDLGKEAGQALVTMVDLVMASLTDPTDRAALHDLADEYGVQLDQEGVALDHLPGVIRAMRSERLKLSFSDMIDQALVYNYRVPSYDLVLVDEAQDINASQAALIERLVGTWGRLVAIGDPAQAIYRFRGAGADSMGALAARFSMQTLPLTTTFRCGKRIVAEAKTIVPDYQAAPSNPEGEVLRSPPEAQHTVLAGLTGKDMVLCRTNAPLVGPCLRLVRAGKPAYLLGRDLAGVLVRWIERFEGKSKTLDQVLDHIELDATSAARRLADKDPRAAAEWLDRADTLAQLAEDIETIEGLKSRIHTLFSAKAGGVPFSTVHKAKGLEADRVVILRPDLLPPKWIERAKNKAQAKKDEDNIRYVAITRAKHSLIYQESKQNA